MDLPFALAIAGAVVLVVLWVVHLRRDLRRRAGRAAEFEGVEGRGTLWTTAARCPDCHAAGALLSEEAGQLWHTCLARGHRHRRETRG